MSAGQADAATDDTTQLFAPPEPPAGGTNAERVAAGLPPRGRPPGKGRPKAKASTKADKAPASSRQPKARFKPALMEYVGSVGGMLTMAGVVRGNDVLTYDGQILLAGAEDWADAMELLASENPQVRRVLEIVVQTSAWSQVVTATAAMVVPILAAHRIIPPVAATVFGADLPPEPPARPTYDEETGVRTDGAGNGVWPAGTAEDHRPDHMAPGFANGHGHSQGFPPTVH